MQPFFNGFLKTTCLIMIMVFACCKKDDTPEPDPVWVEFMAFSDIRGVTAQQNYFDIGVQLTGKPAVFPGYINYRILPSIEIHDSTYSANAILNHHFQIEQANIPFASGSIESTIRISINHDRLIEGKLYSVVLGFEPGPFNIAEDAEKKHFVFNFYLHTPFTINDYLGERNGSASSLWGGPYHDVALSFTAHSTDTLLVHDVFDHMVSRWAETWTDGPHAVKVVFSVEIPYMPSTKIPFHQYIGTTDNVRQYWIAQGNDAPFSPLTKKVFLDVLITRQDKNEVIDHFKWESKP